MLGKWENKEFLKFYPRIVLPALTSALACQSHDISGGTTIGGAAYGSGKEWKFVTD